MKTSQTSLREHTCPVPRRTFIRDIEWLEADGVTGWLQHSGSWGSPDDQGLARRPYYRSNVQRFRLRLA